MNSSAINPDLAASSLTKKKLLLRDSLTFLSLLLLTVVLFTVTLFLFRSFTEHRAELAIRWSDRGRQDIASGHPERAIQALRTALSYAPGERSYELLLAQALGDSGNVEEAFTYFTGLWDARPGDGFINLQLARLAAKKKDKGQAINFYRASVYGTWEGDGVQRRREVRLELARYLLQQGLPADAREELLIAGGNYPETPQRDIELARLLAEAKALPDAAEFYGRALAGDPKNVVALSEGGRLAYSTGDFVSARRLLGGALREIHSSSSSVRSETPVDAKDLDSLLDRSERILALAPFENLRSSERVGRILEMRGIAQRRLDACAALPNGLPASMSAIEGKWATPDGTASRADLLRDSDLQQSSVGLIYETEWAAAKSCGAATGDDALLLLISRYPAVSGVPGAAL